MPAQPRPDRILNGPIPLETLRFGLPIAAGMGLQTVFNLVDAYIVSRLTPDVAGPALGAIGICDQLTAIGTILSYGLTTASTALIAQAHGRGEKHEVRRLAWQSMLAVSALSIVFGFLSIFLAGPIVAGAVGAKGKVSELGTEYLRVIGGGSFSIYFLFQLTGIQRALGSAKTPVLLLVLSNVLNLFLAVLLVYGPGPAPPVFSFGPVIASALHIPRLELVGAAWATVLARTITLVPVVILLAKRFDVMDRASIEKPDRAILGAVIKMGWPSSAQFVVRMLAMLLTHSLVARIFTTATDQSATTALGIVFRLETMAFFIAMGWGSAAQTFVAQNLGAGNRKRARHSGMFSALYCGIMLLFTAFAFARYGTPIVEFFDKTPAVVAISTTYIAYMVWSYVGLGIGVVLGSAITGSGATRTTLVTDLGVVLAFQVPASLAAVWLSGSSLPRLWTAIAVTYGVSAIVYALVFRFVGWMDAMTGSHVSNVARR
ncbi:MAG: MATE family efflux transporter [Polyangiaceae bacterium]|nr:MATE family efflux transporter [Polyangiaceae bacterium]NUQ76638.1 MATE family efflux transporter [Polyangiaceae bacterium]